MCNKDATMGVQEIDECHIRGKKGKVLVILSVIDALMNFHLTGSTVHHR